MSQVLDAQRTAWELGYHDLLDRWGEPAAIERSEQTLIPSPGDPSMRSVPQSKRRSEM